MLDAAAPGAGTSGASFAWTNSFGKIPRDYHDLNVAGMEEHAALAKELPGGGWLHQDGALAWEDSPAGWPQDKGGSWWRRPAAGRVSVVALTVTEISEPADAIATAFVPPPSAIDHGSMAAGIGVNAAMTFAIGSAIPLSCRLPRSSNRTGRRLLVRARTVSLTSTSPDRA